MEVTQDQLLTIILVAVIANMAVIALVLAARRFRRDKPVLSTPYQSPSVDQVMATSYVNRSASQSWSNGDDVVAEVEARALAEPDGGDEPAEAEVAVPSPAAATTEPAPSTSHDPLSGLLDAAGFSQRVADEELRIRRYGRPATIAMLELDGLERLVERLGPEAAERVVPAVADTLQRLARGSDHVARVDAGRFAVLLPETDEISAINYIERVRRACDLWLESGAIAMRLSVGWSGTSGEPPLAEAQRTATERMFAESRRNARRAE